MSKHIMNDVYEESVPGIEISECIKVIESVTATKPAAVVMMACVALALTIQDPNITIENLQEGVFKTTQYMTLWLMETEHPIDKEKVN